MTLKEEILNFLSENKDYTLSDILTHAKKNKDKVKAFQKVAENEEIIASNYEIMQLYTSTISSQGVRKLKYAIQNDGIILNRTKTPGVAVGIEGGGNNHYSGSTGLWGCLSRSAHEAGITIILNHTKTPGLAVGN